MKSKFLVIIILLLFGCKKGQGDFVLKGKITDSTFSQAHSGATVQLYKVPTGTTEQILIGTTVLNSTGEYSFTFPRDKMEKFIIKVEKEGYFEIFESIYFSTLTLKEDNIRNYSTTAKGWIKIRVKNDNPLPTDYFHFIKQQGKANCAECCPIEQQTYYGSLDTTIYCINDGNTVYSIYYFGTGMSSGTIDGVTTTAFDTTELVINY